MTSLQDYITSHEQLYDKLLNRYFISTRSTDTKLHVYMTKEQYEEEYEELELLLEWYYHYVVDGLPVMQDENLRAYMTIKLYDKDYENYSEDSASPYFIYLHIELPEEEED